MAVKLVRAELELDKLNNDKSTQLPVLEITSKEVKAPEYFQGKVTARTNNVFTSDGHQRQIVWQNNFARRQSQLTDGGFHGTPGHKYTEVGEVVLDDSTLILQALGQEKRNSVKVTDAKIGDNLEMTTGGRSPPPILRSRTPSQFPDELKSLHTELSHSNAHLNQIRKGQGLFHLLKQEKELLQIMEKNVGELEKEQNCLEWKEAAAGSDSTHELVSSPEDTDIVVDIESEVHYTYRVLCVILWVLDCMKLESPQYMPALATYWRITRPQLIHGKRIYERQQAMLSRWEEITTNKMAVENQTRKEGKREAKSHLLSIERQRIEMEKMSRQKHLTPEQFEKLKIIVNEELNKSKKKARMKIKELMEESSLKYRKQKSSQKKIRTTSVGLDVEQSQLMFGKVDESRGMVLHEQLTVMSRERKDALEQRFSSLTVSGGLWKDIGNMRSGVKIETTAMAYNKLMMNYDWISELKESLSDAVFKNKYCENVLDRLCSMQEYMKSVGPSEMSQEKLIQVLSTLHSWQMDVPEVSKAIEFIIKSIIYIVPEDYQKWAEYNSKQQKEQT